MCVYIYIYYWALSVALWAMCVYVWGYIAIYSLRFYNSKRRHAWFTTTLRPASAGVGTRKCVRGTTARRDDRNNNYSPTTPRWPVEIHLWSLVRVRARARSRIEKYRVDLRGGGTRARTIFYKYIRNVHTHTGDVTGIVRRVQNRENV